MLRILRIRLGVVAVAVASVRRGPLSIERTYTELVTPPSTRARLGLDLDAAIVVL